MSAYFDSGFCVRKPSWHRQERLLDDYPTDWNDAREKAGLLWEPEARESYQLITAPIDVIEGDEARWAQWLKQFPEGTFRHELGALKPLPDHKLIVRNDNENVLGVVGQGYELISNGEMGDILSAILDIDNVKFETAGSCKGGAFVWALAYLDEPYTLPGDNTETYPFVTVLNAHDGTGAAKAIRNQIRVVCWNTYNAASLEGERTGLQYTFRHTAKVHDRIEEAKMALSGMRDDAAEWTALATELIGLKVDDETFKNFVSDFIPEPPADIVSERVRNNVDVARKAFTNLYLDSPTTEAHRGTGLGLVDASVEYLDHVRGFRNSDSYLGRTLLRPEPLKAKAVKLVRELIPA